MECSRETSSPSEGWEQLKDVPVSCSVKVLRFLGEGRRGETVQAKNVLDAEALQVGNSIQNLPYNKYLLTGAVIANRQDDSGGT